MDEKRLSDIEAFIGQQIPEELRLNIEEVVGKVVFPLKPTVTSAISSTGSNVDPCSDKDGDGLTDGDDRGRGRGRGDDELENELDDLIDGVAALEDKVEQIEELIDLHIKDMAIPSVNDLVKKAVDKITPDTNGVITANTFKKAKSIIDHTAMFNFGQDFVLGALTGDGALDGDWMQCSEVTKDIAKNFRAASEKNYGNVDIPVKEQSMNAMENHNKSILRMLLDIILKLHWNMLWPKFIVDLSIINPVRMIIAHPIDGIIGFFSKWGSVRRFKRKSKELREKYGPINKLLNKVRIFLICKLPPKMYKAYDPMVEIDCPAEGDDCIEPTKTDTDPDPKGSDKTTHDNIGGMYDSITDSIDECPDEEILLRNADTAQPEGLGLSTECLEAANLVLEAVMNDALTASGPDNSPWLNAYDNLINGSEN